MKYTSVSSILLCALLMWQCTPEPEEVTPYENPFVANDNALIFNQELIGSDEKASWFFNSCMSQSDGFYLLGELDAAQASTSISVGQNNFQDFYETIVSRYDNTGKQLWEQRPGFSCRSFIAHKNTQFNPKELLFLFGNDSNEDDKGRSRIMIFDADGNFLKSHQFDAVNYFYDVEVLASTANYVDFIAVGNFDDQVDITPYIQKFRITKSFDYIMLDEYKLLEKNKSFSNIEIRGDLYIISGSDESIKGGASKEVIINAYNSTFQSVWGYSLQSNGKDINHRWKQLTSDNNNVYLMTHSENVDKSQNDLNKHWYSIDLYALNIQTGSVKWSKTYSETDYHDIALSITNSNNELILAGLSAGHQNNDLLRSNGLVKRISKTSGTTLSSRQFGNTTQETVLENCIVVGENAFFSGYKFYDSQTQKAYRMVVKLSDL
jgi:hypothetical protein